MSLADTYVPARVYSALDGGLISPDGETFTSDDGTLILFVDRSYLYRLTLRDPVTRTPITMVDHVEAITEANSQVLNNAPGAGTSSPTWEPAIAAATYTLKATDTLLYFTNPVGCEKSFWYGWGEDNYGPYQSPYVNDVLSLWEIIKTFEGTLARWELQQDGRLKVQRADGAIFTY